MFRSSWFQVMLGVGNGSWAMLFLGEISFKTKVSYGKFSNRHSHLGPCAN